MKFLLYLWLISASLYAQDVRILSYSYYVDDLNTWTVEDAYAHKEKFKPLGEKTQSLGFRAQNVWVYVKVENHAHTLSSNVLLFSYPQHDNITVHEYSRKVIVEQYLTGDLNDFNTRKIQTRNFAVPYTLQSKESKEFLFKIESNSSLNIGIKFYTQEEYSAYKANDELFLSIYYSVVFMIIFYNFMLYLIVKEKVYLYYSLFHFVYFFLQFAMNGLSFQFLYPSHPELNLYAVPISFILANYLSIHFVITYLDLDIYAKHTMKYLKFMMHMFTVMFVLIFFLPYAFVAQTMTIMGGVSAMFLFVLSIYVWYRYRTMSSKVFLTAWMFSLSGALITVLQNLGILNMSVFTNYAAQIGSLIELSLLSLNLAYTYNVVFKQSKEREIALEELTQTLEQKVELRTQEINDKNKTLQLAINNRNVLFKELYHRVKNNLQIISSLLSLQSMDIKDKASRGILDEMSNRIKAISFIHEKLYKSDDLTFIYMGEYLSSLVEKLRLGLEFQEIQFEINCQDITLNIEQSMPVGLIVNELVTNAIKHAFDSRNSTKIITITMKQHKDNTLVLQVSDNGKGANIDKVQAGFGFQLVESMVKYQPKGKILSQNKHGMQHTITFEKEVIL